MQDEAISSAAARHVYIWLRAGSEDPTGAWRWRRELGVRSEHQVLGAEKHPACLINAGSQPSKSRGGISQRLTAVSLMEA